MHFKKLYKKKQPQTHHFPIIKSKTCINLPKNRLIEDDSTVFNDETNVTTTCFVENKYLTKPSGIIFPSNSMLQLNTLNNKDNIEFTTNNTTINKQREQLMIGSIIEISYINEASPLKVVKDNESNREKKIEEECNEDKRALILRLHKERMELNHFITLQKQQIDRCNKETEKLNKKVNVLKRENEKDTNYIDIQQKEIERLSKVVKSHK